MFIYGIQNKIDRKVYVGQTTQQYKNRRAHHLCLLRRNAHFNIYLQNAWNKYGEENFEFLLLEENINTQEELDRLEEEYRLKYYPNVYNFRIGGNGIGKLAEKTKKLLSIIHSGKILSEEHKTNISIAVSGPNNGNYGNKHSDKIKDICRAAKLQQTLDDAEKNSDRFPLVISPEGIIYKIKVLRWFAKEHNLHASDMHNMFKGKQQSHKGWTIYNMENIKNEK